MIQRLKITDKNLHRLFIGLILTLSATTLYFALFAKPADPTTKLFWTTFGNFDKELSLQQVPEKIKPGALRVPILIYHSILPHTPQQSPLQKYYDVSPEAFAKQMQYLKDSHYVVLSLEFLMGALQQNIALPEHSVVLTFDDGWRSQYTYAFPILKKYGFTATFFIYTNAIDHEHFLTWDQIRLMDDEGMTIGGHTKSHPYLPDIHNEAQLKDEIIGGKKIIEDQIRQPIDLFAYPFGNYRDQIIDIVKQAGYAAARSTYNGKNHTKDDLYKLKAIEVTDDLNKFAQDVAY